MYLREVEITCKNGLHIRPAALFVKKAKEFESDIIIISDGKEASSKSLFKFQTLSLENGRLITIKAEGSDEIIAVEALVNFISTLE